MSSEHLNILKNELGDSIQSAISRLDNHLNELRLLSAAIRYKPLEDIGKELDRFDDAITESMGPMGDLTSTAGKAIFLRHLAELNQIELNQNGQ